MSALGITIDSGLLGAIIHFVIAALVLMFSARIVPGLRVKGFTGALVGALALAVVAWLVTLVLVALVPAA